MTAMTTTISVPSDQAADAANRWLTDHHDELASRARAVAPRKTLDAREEAVAEMLALIVLAVHSAAKRGRLDQLTAFWLVTFAGRQLTEGRRACGYSSRCAMADATRVKRGVHTLSLDRDFDADDPGSRGLSDVLTDRRADDPVEVVRRDHDYNCIFECEQVSEKGRRTFEYLAQTHGDGKQAQLAAELMVSPGRITQLKSEIAEALAAHGYHGPLGPRPAVR